MVFLLELLEPAGAIRFEMTLRISHSLREETCFVPDDGVRKLVALPLMVPSPVG